MTRAEFANLARALIGAVDAVEAALAEADAGP